MEHKLPLALLVWELSCGTSLRAALHRQWTSWAMLLAGAVYFLLSERYLQHMQNSTQFNTMTGNAATQAIALVYLARQWALPLWLNIDPDLAVQRDFSKALPALAFVALWLAAMVWYWRSRPWIGLALAWAFLHWVPLYLFLPRLDVANDRQLYLAIWPLCLAVVIELGLHLPRRLALGASACLVVLFAALTVVRNQDYRTEIALWEATVALSPDKSRVHNNLGYAYRMAGRLQDARREYLVALHLDPGNVKARLNLRRLNLEQSLQGGEKEGRPGFRQLSAKIDRVRVTGSGIWKSEVVRKRDKLLALGRDPCIDAVRVDLGNTGSQATIDRFLEKIEGQSGGAIGFEVAVNEAI
jgi:hypothetical protein